MEKKLSYERFIEWTNPDNMHEREMEVFLPRFKLEETYNMEDVLRSMGMVDAFEQDRADFSGMSSKKDLYLSKVMHKSFVEVNEEGTEAAAATTEEIVYVVPVTPSGSVQTIPSFSSSSTAKPMVFSSVAGFLLHKEIVVIECSPLFSN